MLDCMEFLLIESENAEPEIVSVEELLNSIGDEKLLHILLEADRKTLQIVVLKMMGYAPKEIAVFVGRPEQTVYTKLRRLREKIRKILNVE